MLHHIGVAISTLHSEAENEQLINMGLDVEAGEQAWVHYRSLYITDPEWNVLEFVRYDASL
jgi:hypothetical protein